MAQGILWLNLGHCGSLELGAVSLWVMTCVTTLVERVIGQTSR